MGAPRDMGDFTKQRILPLGDVASVDGEKTAPDGAHFAVVFLPSKRMRDVGHANNWQNFQSNPCHDKGESLSWAGFEIGYEVAIL